MIKKTIIIILSIHFLLIQAAQATVKHGVVCEEGKFVGYINRKNYSVQKDNEITFIYRYKDGTEKRYEKIPVYPSGTMMVPEYKELQVVDITGDELKDIIQAKLDLESVDIFMYRTANNVAILGEVRNPGSYAMKDIKTVYDAIAKAGGFSSVAKRTKVTLIRQRIDGTRVSYDINFPKEVFKAYEPGTGVGEDIYIIQEGDLIFVPGSFPKKSWDLIKRAFSAATLGGFIGLFSGLANNMMN
jgi:protein involved in polysaccharide export with SLBB domain